MSTIIRPLSKKYLIINEDGSEPIPKGVSSIAIYYDDQTIKPKMVVISPHPGTGSKDENNISGSRIRDPEKMKEIVDFIQKNEK